MYRYISLRIFYGSVKRKFKYPKTCRIRVTYKNDVVKYTRKIRFIQKRGTGIFLFHFCIHEKLKLHKRQPHSINYTIRTSTTLTLIFLSFFYLIPFHRKFSHIAPYCVNNINVYENTCQRLVDYHETMLLYNVSV